MLPEKTGPPADTSPSMAMTGNLYWRQLQVMHGRWRAPASTDWEVPDRRIRTLTPNMEDATLLDRGRRGSERGRRSPV